MTDVLVLLGSLRRASIHRRLSEAAQELAGPGVRVHVADDLASLPFYDEDLDVQPADPAVQALRDRVAAADALLLLSPVNNGGTSAVLKNALDWASRPRGASPLDGKPAAVLSAGWAPATTVEATAHVAQIAGARVLTRHSLELAALMQEHPRDVEVARTALAEALEALAQQVPADAEA